MNNIREKITEDLNAIFTATDAALSEWVGEGCLQFPTLLGMMAIKMNWNDKQVRENDPIVRYYIRNNPKWYIIRGAHGGIMATAIRDKKENERLAKAAQKAQARAETEAKLGLATTTTPPVISPSILEENDDTETDEE